MHGGGWRRGLVLWGSFLTFAHTSYY
jgi:hypothetical protein